MNLRPSVIHGRADRATPPTDRKQSQSPGKRASPSTGTGIEAIPSRHATRDCDARLHLANPSEGNLKTHILVFLALRDKFSNNSNALLMHLFLKSISASVCVLSATVRVLQIPYNRVKHCNLNIFYNIFYTNFLIRVDGLVLHGSTHYCAYT